MKHTMTNGLAARLALCVALPCAPMFAQGPLTSVASGVSADAVNAVQILAVLFIIGMAIWIGVSHSHGVIGRVVSAIFAIYVMLNPTKVASWIQSL